MNDDELKDALAKLRADYSEQLPGAVARMDALWQGLVTAEIPISKLADLARMVHSVTGSGATFGLAAASRAARELELRLDQLAASGRRPGPAEQASIFALLAALRQAAVER